MALEFQPPPAWLLQEYFARKQPAEIASEGVGAAIQGYAAAKQQQQTQQTGATKSVIDLIAQDPELLKTPLGQKLLKQSGGDLSGYTPPSISSGTAPTPMANSMAPTPVEQQAQQSLPEQHPAIANYGQPGVPLPGAQDIMAVVQSMGGRGKLGKQALGDYKTGLETQALVKKNAGKGELKTYTPQQLLDKGSFNPETDKEIQPPVPHLDLGTKESQQQDKLEEQYRKSFQQIRGDASLARTEAQRDAAATVYNRIKDVKAKGEILNPIDYIDSLGQIYKARTGTAPGETVLEEARQATAKGNLGKAFTFLTGEQAPATTQAIMDSLQDMALHMGNQADRFHDGYMRSRMRPPKGLAHDRVANVNAERGMSFAEATAQNEQSGGAGTSGWKYLGPKK